MQSGSIDIKTIGVLGFDSVVAFDLSAVSEVFFIAGGGGWRSKPSRYRVQIVGLTPGPFETESGIRMMADVGFDEAGDFDTLIVPGAQSLRESDAAGPIGRWLKSRAGRTRRMVSVCTGFYGLASSGLLDGRRATTHWRHCTDAQRRFPSVRIEPDAIFVKDGAFYSSAGMSAGIDLALALVEEDFGPELALATAREMVVYMKRTGGQLQYSEPLQFQTRARDRFAELAARMSADPGADWNVESMAAQIGLSPRQFTRRFKTTFETTPGAHLDALRFDEARRRLATSGESLGRIVEAVGLQSEEAFRRAFERRFGVTPAAYRRQFGRTLIASEPRDENRPRL